jgi:hypothetical protein
MPSQASVLLDTLKRVELKGHQRYASLDVFHLCWSVGNGLDYVTLDEALEAQWIKVTEFTEAGQVSRIKIKNRSDRMVFLMAGEQLVGCKQNRVLNTSIMVPAHTELPLPVSCVEQGRWGYSSPIFWSEQSSSHHTLRAMMAGQATQSYRRASVPGVDQASVWREVSRKMGAMGSRSSSNALQDVFHEYDRKLSESVEKLRAPAECNGAVFVMGGNIAGADLFDKPSTLCKLWPKLIRSCAIDALERSTQNPGSIEQQEIAIWLERVASAKQESFPSPGLGLDVRIEGEDVIGDSLVVDGHPVHLELFCRTEPRQAPASGEGGAQAQQQASAEGSVPSGTGDARQSWLRRMFRK